jgi:hypothetical protein
MYEGGVHREMKRMGIIQPGRIVDIIITLPIAAHYAGLGYKVIWPIMYLYQSMFQSVVDYVEFIPITDDIGKTYTEAKSIVGGGEHIDICFGFSESLRSNRLWENQSKTFDEYKYDLAGVSFREKFNLRIRRNGSDEQATYDRVVRQEDYVVLHTLTKRGTAATDFEDFGKHQIIQIDSRYDGETGVFSWLKILEGAKKVILTNSSFLNLVNQLGINEGNRTYYRSCNRWYDIKEEPILGGEWRVI